MIIIITIIIIIIISSVLVVLEKYIVTNLGEQDKYRKKWDFLQNKFHSLRDFIQIFNIVPSAIYFSLCYIVIQL